MKIHSTPSFETLVLPEEVVYIPQETDFYRNIPGVADTKPQAGPLQPGLKRDILPFDLKATTSMAAVLGKAASLLEFDCYEELGPLDPKVVGRIGLLRAEEDVLMDHAKVLRQQRHKHKGLHRPTTKRRIFL